MEDIVYNELYLQYEADHSLRSVAHIHPMFYNGTVSKTNEIQTEKPEPLLTKEEFIDEINTLNSKWSFAAEVLAIYLMRNETNYSSKSE